MASLTITVTGVRKGVGRTTVAVNLAVAVARVWRGTRVVLMDCDPLADASSFFIRQNIVPEQSLYRFLVNEKEVSVLPTWHFNIFCLPCVEITAELDSSTVRRGIKRIVRELRKACHIVIIDTPSIAGGVWYRTPLETADLALIVADASPRPGAQERALQDIISSVEIAVISGAGKYAVLPNKTATKTHRGQEVLRRLRNKFPTTETHIPAFRLIGWANMVRKTTFEVNSAGRPARHFRQLARELPTLIRG